MTEPKIITVRYLFTHPIFWAGFYFGFGACVILGLFFLS